MSKRFSVIKRSSSSGSGGKDLPAIKALITVTADSWIAESMTATSNYT